MDVALFRPYDESKSAKILSISEKELIALRQQGKIAYLHISGKEIRFLGNQLLTYLLDCIVPVGVATDTDSDPAKKSSAKHDKPEAELVSVGDALALLGIGRTKLYELLGDKIIESVKIGRRTLVKRASLRHFIDSQFN
ncbi:MAG: helix-turn-helix domain-containing protein [Magnetococcales bacterium]|nr:helix-turn-helix domain-containing protein [Magnetococcales bacterium]